MIIFGVVFLVIGLVTRLAVLETIGVVLIVIGLILWLFGALGRSVGGRRHYY